MRVSVARVDGVLFSTEFEDEDGTLLDLSNLTEARFVIADSLSDTTQLLDLQLTTEDTFTKNGNSLELTYNWSSVPVGIYVGQFRLTIDGQGFLTDPFTFSLEASQA